MLVQQQINNFSAQIRGSIIQSKQFRVVDVDNGITQNILILMNHHQKILLS